MPRVAPQPWLTCCRCDCLRPFRSSDKVRVNANGKRLDAWLIYRCTGCDSTWKRPLLERQSVRDIDPAVLDALQGNDSRWVRRRAFDIGDLKRWSDRVEEFAAVDVEKRLLATGATGSTRVEIQLTVPVPTCLRTDRLLANELDLSRSRIQALQAGGLLTVSPHGPRPLRGPVRDGMCVCIDATVAPATAQLVGGLEIDGTKRSQSW